MTSDARVDYRAGAEFGPAEFHGRFELTLTADGAARLEHRQAGVVRRWTARIEPVVWPRLLAALRRGGFPRTPPPGEPGGPRRELAVTGAEPAGDLVIGWDDAEGTDLGAALGLLDALVHQVSNGAIRGVGGDLPWVTHEAVAQHSDEPVPMPAGAFGTLGGRAVAGIVRLDGSVAVIVVPEGTPLAELPPTGSPPRTVAFTDVDGVPVVVTGGDDGLLRTWAADGTPRSTQLRHAAPVSALTTTVDDAPLMIWSGDRAGRLLERDVTPGTPVEPRPDQPAAVTALEWAGTDWYDLLVTGADDGTVTIQPVAHPDEARVLDRHTGWVNALAVIGADERDLLVASAGADRVIRLRHGIGGADRPALAGHRDSVTGLAFGLAGDRLLLGSCALDGTVRTWDVHRQEVLADWPAGDDWPAGIADVAAGGVPRWATGGADGVVRVWDAQTGAALLALEPEGRRSAVLAVASALLPGRTLVAAGYRDGALRVWDAVDGTPLGVDTSSDDPLVSVVFGHGGGLDAFVCGTAAGEIRLHDPATAAFVQPLTPHTDQVLAVAAGPDVLVSAGADRTVRVWNARNGWPLHRLTGHTDVITALALGRVDGRTVIASGGHDRTVRTWDAASGAPLLALHGSALLVYCVAFGALAGRPVLAAAGYGDAVRVWDAGSGELLLTTKPVGGFVNALVAGAWRGRDAVIAAGEDGELLGWGLPDGEPIATTRLAATPLALALSPDGALWALGPDGVTAVDV